MLFHFSDFNIHTSSTSSSTEATHTVDNDSVCARCNLDEPHQIHARFSSDMLCNKLGTASAVQTGTHTEVTPGSIVSVYDKCTMT